jgi:uncharacterized protein YyaL (SSP411 family)
VPYAALFEAERAGVPGAAAFALRSLDAVLASPLHDRVDGGFHRYTVDAAWREPHWEKTLDDNALLTFDLLEAWRYAGRRVDRDAAESTLVFLEGRLQRDDGTFAQALDADAAYYADGERKGRRPPARDESVLVAANAHAARAFVRAGVLLDDPRRLALGRALIDRLLAARRDGRVPHALRAGSESGSLADHAALGLAALELFVATGEPRALAAARDIDRRIGDAFATGSGSSASREFAASPALSLDPQITLRDRPTPSGVSLDLELAARLLALDDPTRPVADVVRRARRLHDGRALRQAALGDEPLSNADGIAAARIADARIEVVVTARQAEALRPWREALWREAPGPATWLLVTEEQRRTLEPDVALLAGKIAGDAPVRGYVCRGWVCARPAADVATFVHQLRALR